MISNLLFTESILLLHFKYLMAGVALVCTAKTGFTDGHNLLPDTCSCTINYKLQTADCDDRGLYNVPDCVPSLTEKIILANNYIHKVNSQFKRFEHLLYLDMSANLLVNIENSLFTELSSLKVLRMDVNILSSINRNTFTGLWKLQKLSLMGNVIEDLHEDVFSDLVSLTALNLSGNRLSFIRNYQFVNLSRLNHLDLCSNSIKHFQIHSFAGLSVLKFLSLADNRVQNSSAIPQEIFEPLISIEELHLEDLCRSFTQPTNCTTIDVRLSRMPTLKKLHLGNSVINNLGPGFASLKALEELYLIYEDSPEPCKIESISNKTIANLKNAPLSTFVLYYCEVEYIFPRTFACFSNLTILDLVLTSDFCNKVFDTFSEGLEIKFLRYSVLCQTVGPTLPQAILTGLKETRLEYLELSHGLLAMVDGCFFSQMPKTLKYLYLQFNRIEMFRFEDLHSMNNLLVLDVSNQFQISPAPREILLSHLRPYSKFIEHNLNVSTDASNTVRNAHEKTKFGYQVKPDEKNQTTKATKDQCLNFPRHLRSVNISNSGLLGAFMHFLKMKCDVKTPLTTLKISGVKPFDSGAIWKGLRNLTLLENLDLGGNYIRNIPTDSFLKQTRLQLLSLAGNSLLSTSFDIRNLVMLEKLDLSYNNIEYISVEFTKQIEDIAEHSNLVLYINNNSLKCDCHGRKFVAWLLETTVIHQKDNLMCTYSNGSVISIRHISKIHEILETECIFAIVVNICVTGFILLCLLGSIVALILYKRWKMRYLLVVGRRNIQPYHPLEEIEIQMESDEYISYERDSKFTNDMNLHEFVTHKLYPKLQRRGFKVLIRDELDIGMKLYDVISRALRRCNKVIVLLSKDYCIDYWNVFEFNMAVMEGIYTKRQVTIPITLESIERDDLHEDVYTFLRSEPVPIYTWNNDEEVLLEYLCDKIRDNIPE